MLDNNLLKIIATSSEILELEVAVIEKDYFVTQIIHALSGIENDSFLLVFAGGTCLAKAHKIVKRMSEDVDFKIHLKSNANNYSKSKILKELKEFRSYLRAQLMLLGLNVGEPMVRNEGKYSRIEINYPSAFSFNTQLRPHVLLEFTVSNIRLSSENLFIRTLIEETIENAIIFPQKETSCISICETAIEKWVGLTRRIMAIERGYHHDDKTLIRHVYDLNAIQALGKINQDFFLLANEVVNHDLNQFKNQYAEYAEDPGAEIRQSIMLLKNKSLWKNRYEEFIETMVYDKTGALEYEKAIAVLEQISFKIIDSLSLETA
jgi:predicted nucleotidyltransferase component of viral defense system